jgi:hypothetical protein
VVVGGSIFPYTNFGVICVLVVFAYCAPSPGKRLNREPGEPGRASSRRGFWWRQLPGGLLRQPAATSRVNIETRISSSLDQSWTESSASMIVDAERKHGSEQSVKFL